MVYKLVTRALKLILKFLILRDKVIETLSTLCKNVAITTQLIPC
jgi:hypothetical protein